MFSSDSVTECKSWREEQEKWPKANVYQPIARILINNKYTQLARQQMIYKYL